MTSSNTLLKKIIGVKDVVVTDAGLLFTVCPQKQCTLRKACILLYAGLFILK